MSATMTEFLNDLKQSPIGQAILAERDAKAHDERQKIVAERTQLQTSLTAAADKHDRLIAPLRASATAARAKADEAESRLREAQATRTTEVHSFEARISRIEHGLRQSADPRITGARHDMWRRFEKQRDTLGRADEGVVRRLIATMQDASNALEALELANPEDVNGAIAAVLAPVDQAWTAAASPALVGMSA